MLRNRTHLIALFILLTLSFRHFEANAQGYLPVGPQTDVPVDVVTGGGWVECFRNLYIESVDTAEVLAQCPGGRLMLACRSTGSAVLTLLAQGDRNDVVFDTGNNPDVLHEANGVGWYFNLALGSWGFVRAGDSVIKDECDVDTTGANDERLCWHADAGGGWRCGATQGLNGSEEFERVVYTAAFADPIPTLSEWGLIAMAGILGLIGLIVVLRRKAAV